MSTKGLVSHTGSLGASNNVCGCEEKAFASDPKAPNPPKSAPKPDSLVVIVVAVVLVTEGKPESANAPNPVAFPSSKAPKAEEVADGFASAWSGAGAAEAEPKSAANPPAADAAAASAPADTNDGVSAQFAAKGSLVLDAVSVALETGKSPKPPDDDSCLVSSSFFFDDLLRGFGGALAPSSDET